MSVKILFLMVWVGLFTGCMKLSISENESTTSERFILNYASEHHVLFASDSPVTISKARAYFDGENLIVAGMARRLHEIRLPGTIEMVITNRAGEVLLRENTRIQGMNSNRKGLLERPFRFQLAAIPDQAEKIRLRYVAPSSRPDYSYFKPD